MDVDHDSASKYMEIQNNDDHKCIAFLWVEEEEDRVAGMNAMV